MCRLRFGAVRPWVVLVGLVALFASALIPDSTGEAALQQENAFLKLGNIKGKATTDKYKDQIVFFKFSYQITQQGKWEEANRRVAVFGDVKILKLMDSSSPSLAVACASKEQFPKAEIALVSGKDTYLWVMLEGVIVSSVTVDFASGEARPTEVITLNYQKAIWQWGTAKAGYDLRQNVKM